MCSSFCLYLVIAHWYWLLPSSSSYLLRSRYITHQIDYNYPASNSIFIFIQNEKITDRIHRLKSFQFSLYIICVLLPRYDFTSSFYIFVSVLKWIWFILDKKKIYRYIFLDEKLRFFVHMYKHKEEKKKNQS